MRHLVWVISEDGVNKFGEREHQYAQTWQETRPTGPLLLCVLARTFATLINELLRWPPIKQFASRVQTYGLITETAATYGRAPSGRVKNRRQGGQEAGDVRTWLIKRD